MTSIQPFLEADLPEVLELLHWAKLSLTINHLLWNDWPNINSQKEHIARAVRRSLQDPQIKTLKAVDDASGELVGYIVLTPRQFNEPAKGEQTKSQAGAAEPFKLSEDVNTDILSLVTTATGDIGKEITGTDHIEVTSIVVKQSSRGKGVGRKLMDAAFGHAKSEGLPVWTVAEPAALDFFKSVGLREVKHADMDLSQHAPPHTGFGLFRLTGVIWSPGA